jgi:hypothetical protein
MPFDRSSLQALRNLIADTDLILETTPDLPQNRTAFDVIHVRMI